MPATTKQPGQYVGLMARLPTNIKRYFQLYNTLKASTNSLWPSSRFLIILLDTAKRLGTIQRRLPNAS
ncbi:hypothetical protein NPIL_697461, partial [Nephila pilipes]